VTEPEGADTISTGSSRRQVLERVLGAVVVVAVVIGAGLSLTGSNRAAPVPDESPRASSQLSLAANPFLLDGDVTDVGRYAGLRHDQSTVPEDQRPLPCVTSPMTWGARQASAQRDRSDPHLDATYVEHVLRFVSDEAAADGVQRARVEFASCDKGDPAASSVHDRGPDTTPGPAGLDATLRASRVSTSKTDGEITYYELAVGRLRNLVVVLEWLSPGDPNHGDPNPGERVWTDARLTVAIRRAVG
jgi:hypothetical protein